MSKICSSGGSSEKGEGADQTDSGPNSNDRMDSFPEIEGVIKKEVDYCPAPRETSGDLDSIDINYELPDIKPVIPLDKRPCKRSKEESEPDASKSLKKRKPDQPDKDGGGARRAEDFVKKEPPDYSAGYDSENSVWVDDIEPEYVIPDLPSEFNPGPEEEKRLQQINSPVKNNAKLGDEEGEAEAVEYNPVTSNDGATWEVCQSDCTWDCGHSKQNELLKEAVHKLSSRNTLLEDFIQIEFGEKFEKFVKNRQNLLQTGCGETGKQIIGKSDEVADLLRSIKEREKSKSVERGKHSISREATTSHRASWDKVISSFKTESSDEEDQDINGLTLSQLLKWQDLHQQRKLAICPICTETLHMKNMRDHLMIIHKGIKLTCVVEDCLMEFKTRHLFKKHLLQKHSLTGDVYLKLMKRLEEPVLQWLNETSSTIDNVIRRKKLQAYMDEAKERSEERLEKLFSKSVSEASPIPPPILPRTVGEVNAPVIKPISLPNKPKISLLSTMPPIPRFSADNESSDDDDDVKAVTLSQLLKWQGAGKSRKLTVCHLCNETIRVKNMRDHLLVIHKNIRLTCIKDCRKEFRTRSFLKKHLVQKHWYTGNVESVYSERIKCLEQPFLEWLNERCEISPKHNATTIPNAIKKKRRQLAKEKENSKKRNRRRETVSAPPPRPTPIFFPSPPHPSTSAHLPSQYQAQALPTFYQDYPFQQPTPENPQLIPPISPKFSPPSF